MLRHWRKFSDRYNGGAPPPLSDFRQAASHSGAELEISARYCCSCFLHSKKGECRHTLYPYYKDKLTYIVFRENTDLINTTLYKIDKFKTVSLMKRFIFSNENQFYV